MKKKIYLLFIAALMGVTLTLSGCSSTADAKNQRVLNIWTFTDEARYAVKVFEKQNPDIKVNLLYINGSNYLQKLISVLQTGKNVPDVFFVEATTWPKIKTIPLLENLSKAPYNAGEIAKNQFPYIQDIQKDEKGNIKGLGYQGTPGAFYYRRDLAKKYLGTDDPEAVSGKIASWDTIMTLGEKVAKESNGKVHVLSGRSDIDAVQSALIKRPWIENGKLVIDKARLDQIDLSKEAREKNVEAKFDSWSSGWTASMQKGSVMFYAMPTWALPFVFEANAPKTSGKWGLAKGPSDFSGGGTFLAMYSKSTHKDLAWKFMDFYTSNSDFLKNLAKSQQYFLSNKTIDQELAPNLTSDFLGGQKYFEFFVKAGENVPSVPRTEYDNDMNTIWNSKLNDYLNGNVKTKEQMIKNFKTEVGRLFPEIEVN